MTKQLLALHWKAARWGLLPWVVAAFGVPFLIAGRLRSETVVQSADVWQHMLILSPIFPLLAVAAGATVALATDFNPGSSTSPSLPLIMTIACSQMGMSPLEALVAATRGGARALRLEDDAGTIAPGAPADLVLWDASDYREIPYRYGIRLARSVWKAGREVA